jgi:MoaA/NifB/PqqE/SkfB family radical SAM enzyme
VQFLSNLLLPNLDWIQVEVTSKCNAACVYCPHTLYKHSWQDVHIPVETFKRLLPAFRRTSLVYLQGWGEPLLHPQFFDMVRMAREHGCRTGTTTNGMLCTDEVAERMVHEGLSVVGFSLAGTDESQDAIRRGTRLQEVLQAIRRLDEAKKRLGASLPNIHVAYLWLRSQQEAIRQLPALLEGAGVSQVVVSTLDFVPHPNLVTEALHPHDEEEEAYLRKTIAEVAEDGRGQGVDVHARFVLRYKPAGICTENVTKALVISSRGLVFPCVYRNVPVLEKQGWDIADSCSTASASFGDINRENLSRIWRQKGYKVFRKNHALKRGTDSCGNCCKLFCSA